MMNFEMSALLLKTSVYSMCICQWIAKYYPILYITVPRMGIIMIKPFAIAILVCQFLFTFNKNIIKQSYKYNFQHQSIIIFTLFTIHVSTT